MQTLILHLMQGSSICTFVAEQFAETSPEILAGNGFCRLLVLFAELLNFNRFGFLIKTVISFVLIENAVIWYIVRHIKLDGCEVH